jgi:AraC-like DNA-binding protein
MMPWLCPGHSGESGGCLPRQESAWMQELCPEHSVPRCSNDDAVCLTHRFDEHLSNELFGVEMLCTEIGVSERQLQRKLKAITNKSPNQLITSVRLHRAKQLMLALENNITEIAFQTGFANPSYFSKCFKKEFGLSPSALLQNHK